MCYDTTQGTVGEGYRVTMPSGGSTEFGYKVAVLRNSTYWIIIGLDCLLRVFTLISLREMGFYLYPLERYKVLRELYGECQFFRQTLCPPQTPVSLQTLVSQRTPVSRLTPMFMPSPMSKASSHWLT